MIGYEYGLSSETVIVPVKRKSKYLQTAETLHDMLSTEFH